MLLIKNVNILTCCQDEQPIDQGYIVVNQDKIEKIAAGNPPQFAADAQSIDGKGYTLMPGLIDTHVHIGAIEVNLEKVSREYYPSYSVIRSTAILREILEQGFTSVRDAGGSDMGFRLAIEQGLIPGPRLSVSGCPLSQTGGHADHRLPTENYRPITNYGGISSVVADGVDAVRLAAREELRKGVDFIKVMAGGGAMSPADRIDTAQYSIEELKAIVFEAENAGTYVAAHCYSERSILNCIEAGVRTIEHGNFMTEKSAKAMQQAGTFLVPTLVTYFEVVAAAAELNLPPTNIEKMTMARDAGLEGLRIACEAGVKIGSGSDCLGNHQRCKGKELSLQAKVMGNANAIVAATRTNAEIMGWQDSVGTLKEGKLADLILVAGDPLKDTDLFIDYNKNIPLVVKGGSIVKQKL